MTQPAFAAMMSLLEAAYAMALAPDEQRVWFRLLGPIPDEAALKAAEQLARELPHRPRPADVYQRAKDYIRPLPPPPAPALPDPRDARAREEARAVLASAGVGRLPGPHAVPVGVAVEIIAEKIRGASAETMTARAVYGPAGVMGAIAGRGPYAELWRTLRDRS